ncbi:RagB/SusD family nutrient uptake outer membrane protein [Chryseobacterium indologenes]|uniref:RagB/SusD family nutrient uptake outer membrane protein n=1 Tax=Chryseobacterium indologenes TaxID=253 RepID=UPI001109F8B3|nr:RagB/SusD family nutrient uptake outer membrane protein [Chryseobacterium indologenes]TLX26579.1 RagB/SusD family nutrient uptake outer membrane protein [Chryseobacterium indologenes]
MKPIIKLFKNRASYRIYTVALSIIFLQSCEKMLEVDLPANQIETEYVFNNLQSADAALASLYGNLRDSSPISGGTTGSGVLLGCYTDDLDSYAPAGENTGIRDLYLNVQNDSNAAVLAYWTSAYKEVYMANAIIQGIDQSTGISAKDKSRIKGEALFIRSLIYYYLMQVFGDIPYTTSTDYTMNSSLPKLALPELKSRIRDDLSLAVTLMDDAYRNTERIFPNKKAAQLLLAKVYISDQQWAQAETLLTDILASPLYSFEPDVTKVFLKSGSHILWQIKPKNANDPTQEIQSLYFVNAAPTRYALTGNLVNSFSATDKRKLNWMASVTVGANIWYRADKYKNRTANATEYSIVYRIEEAYLMMAEVQARQNKVGQALPYVNATRLRAGLTTLSASITPDNLLNEIILENRKEFFTEMGHRFLDLKQSGSLQELSLVKPNWKPYSVLWPIPQKELLLNPNLNPQNYGY